mgnify:FL=1
MPDSIYYNVKLAKLTPNALKTAKKCELVNFKLGIVSINTPQIRHTKPETI